MATLENELARMRADPNVDQFQERIDAVQAQLDGRFEPFASGLAFSVVIECPWLSWSVSTGRSTPARSSLATSCPQRFRTPWRLVPTSARPRAAIGRASRVFGAAPP